MTNNKLYNYKSTFFALLFSLLIIIRILFEGTGGGIWNIFQVMFVASGLAVIIRRAGVVFNSPKPIILFTLFSVYIWILSTLYLEQLNIDRIFYFAVIPFAAMVTLVFYNIGLNTNINRNKLIYFFTFYAVAFIFFIGRRRVLTGSFDTTMMVANSYYALTLLPIILVYTKERYTFIPFVITFMVILMSGKRAGMLAVGMMVFLFYFEFSSKKVRKSIQNTAILIIIIIAAYFIYNFFEQRFNLDMISRLEELSEDGGSGRDVRWRRIIYGISNASPIEFLFGHGFKTTSRYVGGDAHNDFLQVFFEYGFFAFILYISFYISLIRVSIKMLRTKYPYARHFLVSVIAALFLAMFSFFIIEPRYIIGSALTWGLLLADWKKYQSKDLKLKLQR